MTRRLTLAVRSVEGLVYDGAVTSIRAEGLDGGFGILPGRRDCAAVLPPGLVLFEDGEGDGFVAVGGGVLELKGGECRVIARDAELARAPEEAAERLAEVRAQRRQRAAHRRGVLDDLQFEALRRLARAFRAGA